MRNIPPQDWKTIRYLKDDEPSDGTALSRSFNQHNNLKAWLAETRTELESKNNTFDPIQAFEKLNQRIKKEQPGNN